MNFEKELIESDESYLIKQDGSVTMIGSKKQFTLEELQAFVGGYIRPVYAHQKYQKVFIVQDDGHYNKELKHNRVATLTAKYGGALPLTQDFVGNVLLLNANQLV